MKTTHLLLALLTLALVVAAVVWEWRHETSPGPLHPSHVALAKLQGKEGCAACHGAKNVEMSSACAACHEDIRKQIELNRGLHGQLNRTAALACATCHTEHTGTSVQLVTDRSFNSAGVADLNKFDHNKVCTYQLAGKHTQLACMACHKNANAPGLSKGQKRYLGLSQECVTCHKDPHEGTYGLDCLTCHGQVHEFKSADGFVHTKRFALEAGHANHQCRKCHEKTGATAVKTLRAGTFAVRACAACHKDPHAGTFGADCASCHGISKPFNQAPEFKHIATFPLNGGHAGLACKLCHEKSGPTSIASLKITAKPVRGCVECHASPHRKSLLDFVLAGGTGRESCTLCHLAEQKTFLSPAAKMTPQQHAGTGFPLDVPHDKLQCVACHKELGQRKALPRGPELAAQFAKIYPGREPQACEKCHADPHRGQFAGGISRGQCIICHAPVAFTPTTFDEALHARTKFPLSGAHRAVACSMCHKKESGVVKFVGVSSACTSCHKDIHNGRFDEPGKPAMVDGRIGCARCHSTSGFAAITWTAQDHDLWTAYRLNGAHATAACTACHKRLSTPDEAGRTLAPAPTACSACHADVHAGQFEQKGFTDCARCHSDGGKFKETIFNHQRDSQFKLDKQHDKLDCAACHRSIEIAPKVKVIRYRPLGTRCQDCHDPRVIQPKDRP